MLKEVDVRLWINNRNYHEVFNTVSRELHVESNICELIDINFESTKKIKKPFEIESDSPFEDNRGNNQQKRNKYINAKLSKLSIHEKLRELNLDDVMMNIDSTSLHPSAMYDEKSVFPETENEFDFKPYMNNLY